MTVSSTIMATEQESSSRNVNVHTDDITGDQAPPPQDSPTGVADEDLTLALTKREDAGDKHQGKDVHDNTALTTTTMHQIQITLRKFKSTLDRKTITTAILSLLALFLSMAVATACCICLVGFITSPLWLPLVIFTSPIWFPILLFTSPLWLTLTVLLCATVVFWTTLVFAVLLFFVWPADWLPRNSSTATWLLRQRDTATVALIKLQAKLVLYAAGVGPLADAAFLILDRVDVVAISKTLQEFDVQEWTDQLRQMDLQQLQVTLMQALWSIVK
jgi:hypothetical protein